MTTCSCTSPVSAARSERAVARRALRVAARPRRDQHRLSDAQVEIDASAYMEELKSEAQALRSELAKIQNEEAQRDAALSQSISAYVSSLPEPQLKVLTSGISDDVQAAMRLLVEYILKAPGGGIAGGSPTQAAKHRHAVFVANAHASLEFAKPAPSEDPTTAGRPAAGEGRERDHRAGEVAAALPLPAGARLQPA